MEGAVVVRLDILGGCVGGEVVVEVWGFEVEAEIAELS